MNKIALYILLVICYLGLAKNFSPTELGVTYIANQADLSQLVDEAPVTIILADMHSTGFLIKTHYHKYRIVFGYEEDEEIVVRASEKFTKINKDNIGMSIFRRNAKSLADNFTPLPPGSIFIGDPVFGRWKRRSGKKSWKFYRLYRHLPKLLRWGKFNPSYKFYNRVRSSIEQNKAFYGVTNEFGTKGELSKKHFPDYFDKGRIKDVSFKLLMMDYLKENFYHKI
ncbi:hypothetical protein N9B72_00155 [Bacteriovoracaceae bacterium]|nr:hypothetical protein [Bacteriovoracaceae bacterium]